MVENALPEPVLFTHGLASCRDCLLNAAIGARIADRLERDRRPTTTADATLLVGVALVVSSLAMAAGRALPPVGDVLTPFAWGILLLTTAGLLLSLTPLARSPAIVALSEGKAVLDFVLPRQGVSLLVLDWE